VRIFPISASGNVSPIGVISGDNTYFREPAGIALDGNGNIYITSTVVPVQNSIAIFPAGSKGNVTPSAIISGSATELNYPMGVALDADANIYVSNYDGSPWVTVFTAGSNGNVAPMQAFLIENSTLVEYIAVDANKNMYVTNGVTTSGTRAEVTVWPAGSNGAVTPSAVISGPATHLSNPVGIAIDSADNIYVADNTYETDENTSVLVFSAGANGNAKPLRIIKGSKTKLDFPVGIALDANDDIYVSNSNNNSITVYAAGSSGNVAPIRIIKGAKTGFNSIAGIAIH
jgi:hypothetical protein